MTVEWTSLSSRCISVSTTPGAMLTVQTSGSSSARVVPRCAKAALEAPYAPHALTARLAAPVEVKIMQPLLLRRAGMVAWLYSLAGESVGCARTLHGTYQCDGTKEVHVKVTSPVFCFRIFDSCCRVKHRMVEH